jgi:signal transduction histidine kinase/FixJ family two-component response regulator
MVTSEGLVRYAPPLWRTPAPVRHIHQPVHAITEDRNGHLWFAATEYLIELDGATWRIHPLPKDHRTHTALTENLTALPDGRIVVKGFQAETLNRLLVFDPKTRAWSYATHPEGREIGRVWRRRDGTLWVRTSAPCRLEILDGRTFQPRRDIGSEPLCNDSRAVMEASDGAVWVGTGIHAGGVYRRGKLEVFGPAQGYPETAALAIFEREPGLILVGGRDVLAEFDGKRWTLWRSGWDRVQSIMQSRDGTLRIASGTGIHRLQDGSWITNGEEDGLPSDISYKVFQDSRGRIWAGTSRGLSLYHPEADTDPPRAMIAPANNPRSAPPDGSIKFTFSGIDKWKYTASDRLLFSYRLDGGAWSAFAASGTASLEKLSHGSHRIEVRAMDRNGNAGPASEPFQFTVVLPWYKQAGFMLIAGCGSLVIFALLGFAASQYREQKRAQQAAVAANRAKSVFLANMSHEIRTPMNAIMGMTELALELTHNPEQCEYLSTVQKSAVSLLTILNDILDLSKVEAGKLDLEPVDFNLRECAEDTLRTLRLRAEEKGLALACRIAPEVPAFLLGDDRRLRQVLLNLVGNAIKFTERGEVSVEVALLWTTQEALTLQFRVADTGIGVPADKQKILFRPFVQADNSTTRNYGGTGLGLAISAQLVRLMHGTIWVESPWRNEASGEQVAGSAFYFTARLGWGKPPQPPSPAASPVVATPLRVLLVEDNAVNRKLASRLLEKLGHSVVTAADGQEALEALETLAREPVDVILMDIQMPRMDGFEATAAIRQRERARGGGRIPIVALTACALRGDREKCLAVGMDAHLAKPIQRQDLARVLAEVVHPCVPPPPETQTHLSALSAKGTNRE